MGTGLDRAMAELAAQRELFCETRNPFQAVNIKKGGKYENRSD